MNVFTLDTENMTDYVYFLTPDIAENIGRTYYRGIVVEEGDGEPVAAMVWEVRNVLSGGPKESNIIFSGSMKKMLQIFFSTGTKKRSQRMKWLCQGIPSVRKPC